MDYISYKLELIIKNAGIKIAELAPGIAWAYLQ